MQVLGRLCGLDRIADQTGAASVTITTQVTVDEGRPDIEIRVGGDTLVYVEVKAGAPLGVNQLEYYYSQLHSSGVENTRLVLLSRSRITAWPTTLETEQYHHVMWYQIYNWLAACGARNPVSRYLIESFLEFLQERGMTTKHITWEYIKGVPALISLTEILETAIGEVMSDRRCQRTAGWSWRGFYVGDGYWSGVRYDRPLLIVFEDNRGNAPLTYKRDLDLEQVHFFSLNKDEQFELLVDYLRQVSDELKISGAAVDVP